VKDLDDVLQHYGIKGMRWGIRRANPSASAPASEDHQNSVATKKQIKTSGTKSLSNQELKTYLERMDLEQRYNKANPSASKKAGKAIGEFLVSIGKKELAAAASKEVAKALTKKVVRA